MDEEEKSGVITLAGRRAIRSRVLITAITGKVWRWSWSLRGLHRGLLAGLSLEGAPERVTAPLWQRKMSQRKIDPPSPSRLPPRPQTYSKGTATNLPEKEISAFLSMFLNEALTLLWFHREVEELLGGEGGGKGAQWPGLCRDDRIHTRPLCPPSHLGLTPWPSTSAKSGNLPPDA